MTRNGKGNITTSFDSLCRQIFRVRNLSYLIIILFLAFSFSSFFSCAHPSQNMDMAKLSEDRGDWESALQYYQAELNADSFYRDECMARISTIKENLALKYCSDAKQILDNGGRASLVILRSGKPYLQKSFNYSSTTCLDLNNEYKTEELRLQQSINSLLAQIDSCTISNDNAGGVNAIQTALKIDRESNALNEKAIKFYLCSVEACFVSGNSSNANDLLNQADSFGYNQNAFAWRCFLEGNSNNDLNKVASAYVIDPEKSIFRSKLSSLYLQNGTQLEKSGDKERAIHIYNSLFLVDDLSGNKQKNKILKFKTDYCNSLYKKTTADFNDGRWPQAFIASKNLNNLECMQEIDYSELIKSKITEDKSLKISFYSGSQGNSGNPKNDQLRRLIDSEIANYYGKKRNEYYSYDVLANDNQNADQNNAPTGIIVARYSVENLLFNKNCWEEQANVEYLAYTRKEPNPDYDIYVGNYQNWQDRRSQIYSQCSNTKTWADVAACTAAKIAIEAQQPQAPARYIDVPVYQPYDYTIHHCQITSNAIVPITITDQLNGQTIATDNIDLTFDTEDTQHAGFAKANLQEKRMQLPDENSIYQDFARKAKGKIANYIDTYIGTVPGYYSRMANNFHQTGNQDMEFLYMLKAHLINPDKYRAPDDQTEAENSLLKNELSLLVKDRKIVVSKVARPWKRYSANLLPDDVIVQINNKPVTSVSSAYYLLGMKPTGTLNSINILRNNRPQKVYFAQVVQ